MDRLLEWCVYDEILSELERHIISWADGHNLLSWQKQMADMILDEIRDTRCPRFPIDINSALIELQRATIAAMAGNEELTTRQFARLTHRHHYDNQERSREWYLENGPRFKSKAAAADHMADNNIIPLSARVIERHLAGLPSPRDLKERQ